MLKLSRTVLALVALAICLSGPASAEESTQIVEAQIVSDDPIVHAYGVIIRESAGTDLPDRAADQPVIDPQKPAAVIRDAVFTDMGDSIWKLSVTLEDQDILPKTRVTFVATTASGAVIPGPLSWISEPEKVFSPKDRLCQSRPDSDQITKLFSLDEKALRTLLEVRTTRAQVLENRLRDLLSPATIEQLRRLESEFGLTTSPPLTMELELHELTRRIGLIESILKNQ
ncbi:MAG: hypothetical protein KDD66_03175 [Bdellovibrionales bacterium]|nr:hypothetical protein [Bdellovibrionales bacterium]